MAAALACSAFGMAFHTVREFGYAGLADPGTGMIPLVGIQLGLFALWLLSSRARHFAAWALLGSAVFQLVFGAFLSVLPLPIYPWDPQQSLHHYVSHLVYGIAQIPLIVIPRRMLAPPSGVRYA
ncbi:MAG: hypothetical protein ACRDGE_09570 [Candidatus Limnocylindria bacterium]